MPNTNKIQTGKLGEELAADWLVKHGYQILARNYHAAHGELDIVALQDNLIAFVEVKTARTHNFGQPETWVDERKQRHIGEAADAFLLEHDIYDLDCRFDVIAIDLSRAQPEIKHIKDAFWLEE